MSGFENYYNAVDMVAAVSTAAPIAALNEQANKDGLYFPLYIDSQSTLADLLRVHSYTSRSFRFGHLADNVLGINLRLTNGTLLQLGGRVVKNVTGFDFTRFFCHSSPLFGTIENAVLRLRARAAIHRQGAITGTTEALLGFQKTFLASAWVHAVDALDFICTAETGAGAVSESEEATSLHYALAWSCSEGEEDIYQTAFQKIATTCGCQYITLDAFPVPPKAAFVRVKTTLSKAPRTALALIEKWGGSCHGFAGNGCFHFTPEAKHQSAPSLIAALQRLHNETAANGGHVSCSALVYQEDTHDKDWERFLSEKLEALV